MDKSHTAPANNALNNGESKHTQYPGIEVSRRQLIACRPNKGALAFSSSKKAQTQQWGVNQSMFLGQGMEFAESRIYHPGDDVKNIDWCVSARTGKVHTKLFQAERERPVYIVLDLRSMMHFGSRVRFKSHMAACLAAKIAWFCLDAGDRVGAIVLTREGVKHFASSRSQNAVLRFINGVCEACEFAAKQGQEVSLGAGLQRLRHLSVTSGALFVISDFHDFDDNAQSQLQYLAHKMELINIKVNDPLDQWLPAAGRISNGEQIIALGRSSQQDIDQYQRRFTQLEQKLSRFSRSLINSGRRAKREYLYFVKTDDCEDAFIRSVFASSAHKLDKSTHKLDKGAYKLGKRGAAQ